MLANYIIIARGLLYVLKKYATFSFVNYYMQGHMCFLVLNSEPIAVANIAAVNSTHLTSKTLYRNKGYLFC